jgi:NAD(P)-dependent dehydrogenase (short-subunit alcohol dehydrogenase family)
VMVADIEEAALEAALAELEPLGEARSAVCDVSDRASVSAAAGAAFAAFGRVHVVCNNAGVGAGGPQEQLSPQSWDWVLGVNLYGVIHGVQAFLPHIKAHGEGGHIVNTASMAGMLSSPMLGPYAASKFAVVALSEGLAAELAGSNIGVTALCPGWVKTRIGDSHRNRQARFGPPPQAAFGPSEMAARVAEALRTGIDPAELALRTLAAIRDGDLWVFTHPEMRPALEDRFRRIAAAYDKAGQPVSR